MQYNDTVNKNGGIQFCETLCGMEDGTISGDATLLKTFTMLINQGFDSIMPRLLSYSNYIRWDDINNTDSPIGLFDIVSGSEKVSVKQDANLLDILNITRVKYRISATDPNFYDLEQLTIDSPLATNAMKPNANEVGIPRYFLEKGNNIYLYPQPNYGLVGGLAVWFEREQSYFVSTDTIKEIGIPKPFHALPFLYASKLWVAINKQSKVALLNIITAEIAEKETNLDNAITKRNPTRLRVSGRQINAI